MRVSKDYLTSTSVTPIVNDTYVAKSLVKNLGGTKSDHLKEMYGPFQHLCTERFQALKSQCSTMEDHRKVRKTTQWSHLLMLKMLRVMMDFDARLPRQSDQAPEPESSVPSDPPPPPPPENSPRLTIQHTTICDLTADDSILTDTSETLHIASEDETIIVEQDSNVIQPRRSDQGRNPPDRYSH